MKPTPWPPERWPTPTEWAAWFATLALDEQVVVAERVIAAAQEASRCFEMNHEKRIAHLETNANDLYERNLRVLRHEAETPMRGHDEDGACCQAAALGYQPPARADHDTRNPATDEETQP